MVHFIHILRYMLSLPQVKINMWSENCFEIYKYFVRPHSKYKIIQNKKWGVALLPIPDTFDDYLRGKSKQSLRTNRNNAIKKGYRFSSISPFDHFDEIMDINKSLTERQGRAMASHYLEKNALLDYFQDKQEIYGAFNKDNILKAYTWTPICGDVFIFSRLLGHGNDLDKGIMYFLMSDVIREMIDVKELKGFPKWAMYDTFYGASPGLKYFKERLGFRPFRVKWVWLNEIPNYIKSN